MYRLPFIDSHTGGEPTRVLLDALPRPPRGIEQDAREFWREHGWLCRAAVDEPRGSDILVGAVWWSPARPGEAGQVLYFNNVGPLGMCGHGSIGLIASLVFLGQWPSGPRMLRTPVGQVRTEYGADGMVRIDNVPAYRELQDVLLDVPGYGRFVGDVAWGGNWFFLVEVEGVRVHWDNRAALCELASAMRRQLSAQGITGRGAEEIDHIEITSVADADAAADARNFVLCPGGAFDRSPCGTGTSAKLACLAADGLLAPGAIWRQQGITGSVFEASFASAGPDAHGRLCAHPTLRGRAQVTAQGELLIDEGERDT